MVPRRPPRAGGPVLITGGAGFIGTNLADHLLRIGIPVRLLDNLSRPGVEQNLRWLQKRHGSLLQTVVADLREPGVVKRAVQDVRGVYHFAAQVAVTTSLDSPLHDFDVNARGTLLLLETLRPMRAPPPLLFASTNKVYGALEDLGLEKHGKRYEPAQASLRQQGISETRALEFHSPYGCSKGAADPVRPRLCADLRASGGGLPDELHLRPPPDGQRATRAGSPTSCSSSSATLRS